MQVGNVFYGMYREFPTGKPHYLIVISTPTETMPFLVLTAITSQVEKAKRRLQVNGLPPETLVDISPSDYPSLHFPSVIDCNYPVKCRQQLFEMDFGSFNRKVDMPMTIVNKIVSGILQSPLVTDEIKNLLRLTS